MSHAKKSDDLTRMYAVASAGEAAVLDQLRVKAGLIWHCPQCQLTNAGATRWCDGCRFPHGDLGIEPNRVAFDLAEVIADFDGFRVGSHVPATDFLEEFCQRVLPHYQREVL